MVTPIRKDWVDPYNSLFTNSGTSALSASRFLQPLGPPNPAPQAYQTQPDTGSLWGGYQNHYAQQRTERPNSALQFVEKLERVQGLKNVAAESQRQREQQALRDAQVVEGYGADVFTNKFHSDYNAYLADIAMEEKLTRAQYSPGISGLQDDISDLRKAAKAVGVPFDKYMAARKKLGAGVGEAEDLTDSDVREKVGGIYDDATGEMRAVLEKINANWGEEVATQMTEGVREFEEVVDDALRVDMESIGRLHEKSSEYAMALAQASFSGDIYASLAEKTRIQAQLDNSIQEKAEDLARQRAAQAAAIAAIRDRQFQFEAPDYDTAFGGALGQALSGFDLTPTERQQLSADFQKIYEDNPAAKTDPQAYRKTMNQLINQRIFDAIGLDEATIEGRIDESKFGMLDSYLQNHDLAYEIRNGSHTQFKKNANGQAASLAQLLFNIGLDPKNYLNTATRLKDSFGSTRDPYAQALKSLQDFQKNFDTEWNDMQKGTAQGFKETVKPGGQQLHPSVIGEYLRNVHGLSPAAVAGVLANVKHESGFNSSAVGDNGTSGGLFQHHSERWANLKRFAAGSGRTWSDWTAQVDYAIYEASRMKGINLQSNNPEAVSRAWTLIFERPANAKQKAATRAKSVYEYYYK